MPDLVSSIFCEVGDGSRALAKQIETVGALIDAPAGHHMQYFNVIRVHTGTLKLGSSQKTHHKPTTTTGAWN